MNEASTRLRRIETKPAGRVLRSAPSPKLELPRLWIVGDLLQFGYLIRGFQRGDSPLVVLRLGQKPRRTKSERAKRRSLFYFVYDKNCL